ncbi:MAG: amidohydrolase [Bacteroidetes bacterium HGW-Bacteroidetes-22]|nr:MAG: amidohydrolase [Bacteroidetes bacterium HGW-Bacteroidetes-22]
MIIDSHSHVFLPVEKHLEIMGNDGIDKTVLFPTIIHPEKTSDYSEYKEELRLLNKILRGEINPTDLRIRAISELRQITNDYPDKFVGFGSCPTGLDLEQTGKWINDYVIENSFKGIGELAFGEGQVNKAENIFKSISGNVRYPLWFHTFNPLTLNDIKELLVLAKKYPDVVVILGHGAGSYWLEIIEEIVNMKNVYFDISASFTIYSVKVSSELIPERVLFSVDMPYNSPAVMKKIVDESVKDQVVKELILANNIKRLLGI